MTAEETKHIGAMIGEGWPRWPITAATIALYVQALSPFAYADCRAGIEWCLVHHDPERGSRPSISQLVAAVRDGIRDRQAAVPALPAPDGKSLRGRRMARLFSRWGRGDLSLPELLRQVARAYPTAQESPDMIAAAERIEARGAGPLIAALRGVVDRPPPADPPAV